ncbi:hypothetical protein QUF80_02200 [Desulfococcaceae bacterium HSG8]|nr:hypothetical protein [Desulfococcaceae bacterium HSG8]
MFQGNTDESVQGRALQNAFHAEPVGHIEFYDLYIQPDLGMLPQGRIYVRVGDADILN